MSTYKVIQDIEAEDKLVGPLGFRQFVYFLIASFFGFLCFTVATKGMAYLLVLFAPPMLFCLFFAWPWSPDQPTEVWALAKIRFYFKPRKRIWDQSGVKDFVTITVPKHIERVYTDGLSQNEVRSRLQALANTIDSRGWAVKNAYVNTTPTTFQPENSDRLINFSTMPQEVSNLDIRAADDILDEINNPAASQMNAMIDAATKAHRQDLIGRLQAQGASTPSPAPAPTWFTNSYGPAASPPGNLPPVMDTSGAATMAIPQLPQIPARPATNKHLKTIAPAAAEPVQQVQTPAPQAAPIEPVAPPTMPVPTQADAAILNLAHDNNLNVSTLAREAHKARGLDASDGEVVVALH